MDQNPFLRFLVLSSICALPAQAFNTHYSSLHINSRQHIQARGISKLILPAVNNDSGSGTVPSSSSDEDNALYKELYQRHNEIQTEKVRNALEKQHTKSFLKKRPVKLPYKQAQKWVQGNLGVTTKEEFEDFVAMGYIKTPYISKNPEEYYTRTGDWISWDHFLNDTTTIDPQRGVFD